MLLDLVDNSVDAAAAAGPDETSTSDPSFAGHVEIYRDIHEEENTDRRTRHATGLCIRNNSPMGITPPGRCDETIRFVQGFGIGFYRGKWGGFEAKLRGAERFELRAREEWEEQVRVGRPCEGLAEG